MAKAPAKSSAKSAKSPAVKKLHGKPTAKPKSSAKAPAKKKAAAKDAAPFCWYEVVTPDHKNATKFYEAVVGWSGKDAGAPGMTYTILSAGSHMVAGLMPITAEMKARNVPPCWTGYIAVPDTDDFVKRVVAAGGKLHRPAEDIPNVGRFAVVTDPHGAVFILFTAAGENPNPPPPQGTPGHVGWHELYAGDLGEAFKFYSKLFGWTKARDHDMGPMGVYRIFAVNGVEAGGMMTKPAHVPMPGWFYYFSVDALAPALTRVTRAKGKVLNGPMEVPGGSWIAQCADPWGAHFSLVSGKR